MMCDALRKFMRESAITKGEEHNTNVIICAPVECIQKQWHKTLIRRHVFAREDMYIINGSQEKMSASECVNQYVHVCDAQHRCSSQSSRAKPICAIVTYASSHLLTRVIDACRASLMIFDEAHHLAGIVAQDETDGDGDGMYFGQGRTRMLAAEAAKLGIKRIALTYTPRIARIHERDISSGRKVEFLTMDDELVFGKQIARLDLRKLINDGILPDYRICAIRPHPQASASVSSRASTSTSTHSHSLSRLSTIDNRSAQVGECILRAWVEYTHDINHLIIFARTLNDVRELGTYLRERAANTLVICIGERTHDEDNVKICIERFTKEPRAILINCYKLSEGVDIPCADSVAIAYAKESRGQITQMILRAGRWHPNKPMFRVLIPIIDDCVRGDTTGIAVRPMNTTALTEVLVAMAINDSLIRDELKLRAQEQIASCASSTMSDGDARDVGSPNKHIDLFCFASTDLARIRQIIAGSYVFAVAQGDSVDIRAICAAHNVHTSVEYVSMRANMFPDLPEYPWKRVGKTPYVFLNEHDRTRMLPSIDDLCANIRALGITHAAQYIESLQHARDGTLSQPVTWYGSVDFADYPCIQNILDECVGSDYDQFAKIIDHAYIGATITLRRGSRHSQ